MDISYVFACMLVRDRDQSAAWYERLFGRPPTFLPNEREAVWQVAATASLYLLVDPGRAGQSVVTLVVDNLDAALAQITGRGIATGPIEEIPGAGRKCLIPDPDLNEVSMVQVFASP